MLEEQGQKRVSQGWKDHIVFSITPQYISYVFVCSWGSQTHKLTRKHTDTTRTESQRYRSLTANDGHSGAELMARFTKMHTVDMGNTLRGTHTHTPTYW